MSKYKCKCCSSKERGDFIFITEYKQSTWSEKPRTDAPATRCPKCGELEESVNIVEL